MPIYEYECPNCGDRFELRRGITDDDSKIKCPNCGVENPRRVISSFSTTSSGNSYTPGDST